jgi:mono/diheme cytochrome c family protein
VLLVFRAGSAAPQRADPAIVAGRALYATHCAACHGAEGRGDGPSAAGLATKPANLTEGRLLNHVPDEFLHSVVRGGGAAEGLAPTMPAFGAYLGDAQIRQVVAYVRTLARPEATARVDAAVVAVEGAPRQPIFFSHLIHAGKFQLDCQFCHANARRGPAAGLPSVERCLGCHKVIGAQDNPEIGKIAGYAARGEPIPWVRVFKLPEYVYFAHKPHLRAGVACQACHGAVERMRVVGTVGGQGLLNDLANLVGLWPAPRPLTMGWCVDCHRQQNRAARTSAPLDCVVCHH